VLVQYPDLIVHDAKIVTMDDPGLTNQNPGTIVQAMAVKGNRIQFLGTNEEILRLAGPQTRKLALNGRTVIPGLMHPHIHLHNNAVTDWEDANPQVMEDIMRRFFVSGKTYEELSRGVELIIKEQMANPPPGQWAWIDLNGRGDELGSAYVMGLGEGSMTREKLDVLAPQLPVFLVTHPQFLLNTAARDDFLEFYGVEPTDENEPLAITIDNTIRRSLVLDRYFPSHMEELGKILEEGMAARLSAHGFTTFSSHIQGLTFTPAYRKLQREGRMPIRFAFAHRNCMQVELDIAGCFQRAGDFSEMGDPESYFWNIGYTVGAIDGAGATICSTMPKTPEQKNAEWCLLEPANPYWEAIATSLRSGERYVVNHAIGDRSVGYFLDLVDTLIETDPGITLADIQKRRLTADHCDWHPQRNQLQRMARLGMMLACTPRSGDRYELEGEDVSEQKAQWLRELPSIKDILESGVMVTAESGLDLDYLTSTGSQGAIDRVTHMKMATTFVS
jgi:predicted amidohydrolase YtcJ